MSTIFFLKLSQLTSISFQAFQILAHLMDDMSIHGVILECLWNWETFYLFYSCFICKYIWLWFLSPKSIFQPECTMWSHNTDCDHCSEIASQPKVSMLQYRKWSFQCVWSLTHTKDYKSRYHCHWWIDFGHSFFKYIFTIPPDFVNWCNNLYRPFFTHIWGWKNDFLETVITFTIRLHLFDVICVRLFAYMVCEWQDKSEQVRAGWLLESVDEPPPLISCHPRLMLDTPQQDSGIKLDIYCMHLLSLSL